jgi:hypothetical protein
MLRTKLKGLMGPDVAVVQDVHAPEDTDYRQKLHSLLHSEGPAIDAETLRLYHAERRMPTMEGKNVHTCAKEQRATA